MSDLVGNPEDRFSRVAAQIISIIFDNYAHHKNSVKSKVNRNFLPNILLDKLATKRSLNPIHVNFLPRSNMIYLKRSLTVSCANLMNTHKIYELLKLDSIY